MIKAPPAPAERIRIRKLREPALVIEYHQPAQKRFRPKGRTPIFYHTGEIGDILASLTVMKAMGGGRLQVGPDIGAAGINGYPRSAGNKKMVEFIYDFISIQPYVFSVEWSERQVSVDVNLNAFRILAERTQPWLSWQKNRILPQHLNLAAMHQKAFGVSLPATEPWLMADCSWIYAEKPIVIQRSVRYHNVPDTFPWRKIVQNYGDRCLFVGHADEHREFCRLYGGTVQYFYVENQLEMARLINGSALFIGNQSSPFWIAEGMKHDLILEAWDLDPNCYFDRPGHYHVMDGDWPLVNQVIEERLK